jgi:hypothetical protein
MGEITALSKFHAAALALARRGKKIFPCKPASKEPACLRGFEAATTDAAQIDKWWREDRFRSVALATGQVNDIDVLDLDDGGETTVALLEEQYGPIPPSVEVISGGGGRHVYLKHIPGARNSIRGLGEGLDYKGDGGYVLVPPSIHPKTQRPYVYSVDTASEIATAPPWLVEQVIKLSAATNGNVSKSSEQWHAMFADGIGEGKRNSTLASVVGHLLRRQVDLTIAYELVLGLNALRCSPPLPAGEVVSIVESVGRSELKRRSAGNV